AGGAGLGGGRRAGVGGGVGVDRVASAAAVAGGGGGGMTAALPFGPGALAVLTAYFAVLFVIAFLSRRAKRDDSLADFYLAGRGIGFAVLVLTLYATQYSGNTLLGFSGRTYQIGLAFIMCLHFMTAIIVFYQVFAPRLYRLSHA